MNAAACRSLKSCWSTIPFLKCGNRYAEALTITKIRSFKHEPFFFGGGGGGGELIRGTLRYIFPARFTGSSDQHTYACTGEWGGGGGGGSGG